VYRFRDSDGRVIYVGKAINLRSRLANYFTGFPEMHPRTQAMVTTATSVDWTVVGNEVEALQLEYSWIQEYQPRFNIKYRDDKSYPLLAVTVNEQFPRVHVYRGARKRGVRYFGPFAHAWAIRETVDLMLRAFPIRTCSAGVFRRAKASGRPCLLGYIDKCSAPCVDRVDAAEHRQLVEDFCDFLAGRTDPYVRRLEAEMRTAAAAQDYERAARLRDDLAALGRVLERNAVVLPDGVDADVVGLAEDDLEAAVHLFHVRDGRIRAERGLVVERVEDVDTAGLLEHLLPQIYDDSQPPPRLVLLPEQLPDGVQRWLQTLRGRPVTVAVPKRGDRRSLLGTATRNAEQSLALHKLRRAGDLTARGQALADLQEQLGLERAPLRIEAVDISTLQGTQTVGSLVVFEDGVPRKSDYRRFALPEGADDVSAVREVVRRRFARLESEPSERPSRFAYPPQLLLIDGGAPQVEAAAAEVMAAGSDVPVIGLAKRLEEVWMPGDPDPLILPRGSDALYLLQRVRDEAHRFAISFHRKKRSKSMVDTVLADIPGLGPTRKAALLRHFGSLKRLRAASVEEVAAVPGIGPATASVVVAALATAETATVVDKVTGEVHS
jgi:excinuclease ABC subunit C